MEKELSKVFEEVSKAADATKLCDGGAEYDIASAAGWDSRGCFEVGFHISYWVWLGYSCDYLVNFFVTGLCINEFRGLQFEHQHSFNIKDGEQALERISFGGSHIRETVVAQSRILLFWYCTTY
ncbi:ABC transporter G family member 7-like [Rosa rugosa]|uniref:ABC transporter G family member 7-like n=1 Tax=Rosa rugosa TaxID=74645 RepID=UPI002B410A8D|nr:ABC transporter G family member 7-like [Rosa rugosa]